MVEKSIESIINMQESKEIKKYNNLTFPDGPQNEDWFLDQVSLVPIASISSLKMIKIIKKI